MTLFADPHGKELRAAGWSSRGYLPHFDGLAVPQFITIHLADSIPRKVIRRWKQELRLLKQEQEKILLQRRIEKYLDHGYGECVLKGPRVANMLQDALLKFDGTRYRLFEWVVMPNHLHTLLTRFDNDDLKDILHSLKSFTAHEANKILHRKGTFWMEDYFDRYTRNQEHFYKTVKYIGNNPVKARLCRTSSDWRFSSAWYKTAR